MTTTLYRHYNSKGQLLYVGISVDSDRRFQAHTNSSEWSNQVARTVEKEFPSVEEARKAERVAISSEKPIYNKQSRRFYSPRNSGSLCNPRGFSLYDDDMNIIRQVRRQIEKVTGRDSTVSEALRFLIAVATVTEITDDLIAEIYGMPAKEVLHDEDEY